MQPLGIERVLYFEARKRARRVLYEPSIVSLLCQFTAALMVLLAWIDERAVIGLALGSRGAEITLYAIATAAATRPSGLEVAADLAAAARDAFELRWLRLLSRIWFAVTVAMVNFGLVRFFLSGSLPHPRSSLAGLAGLNLTLGLLRLNPQTLHNVTQDC
jgi:hypothetical protein